MNSSVPPTRRIASNLIWQAGEFVPDPLVTLGADGRIRSVEICPDPDRMAATEHYAGVLIPDFPDDYQAVFVSMCAQAQIPLRKLLAQLPPTAGVLVVISGLDYASMLLTPRSQIQRL